MATTAWHLNEIFVEISGERNYLSRAVDHEDEVLESFASKTRNNQAALKFQEINEALRPSTCFRGR